jgi:hypothetical protein
MKHFTVQFTVCASIDLTMPVAKNQGLVTRWNSISADRKLDEKM